LCFSGKKFLEEGHKKKGAPTTEAPKPTTKTGVYSPKP
jgi:hypothetical protein